MFYPSIEDYKIAITIPESFATLNYLMPVLDVQGFPVFIAGGPAVVFKMQDSRNKEKFYALKCFTQEQPQRKHHFEEIHKYLKRLNSLYMVDYKYLENELWVNNIEYPVLLMEWIEGVTMSRKIEELCLVSNKLGLARLSISFNKMALWLLQQNFAHGDIKPENVQVTFNGNLKLLDYDGMFVPALTGSRSFELGTAEYRHPKRTEADFNSDIDDFSILVLSLSLLCIRRKPELYKMEHQGDSLLFTADDYAALHRSKHYTFFIEETADKQNIKSLFGLLQYAVNLPILKLIGLEGILENLNTHLIKEYITSTDLLDTDPYSTNFKKGNDSRIKLGYNKDKYWVEYSLNWKGLINNRYLKIKEYPVLDNTFVICDGAFRNNKSLIKIYLPESLQSIGVEAFYGCENLLEINLPDGLQNIKNAAFRECLSLTKINIPECLHEIENNPFMYCKNLSTININPNHLFFKNENGVVYKKDGGKLICFLSTKRDNEYIVPENVVEIGNDAFIGCRKLVKIILPTTLKSIGQSAFFACKNLAHIYLPANLQNIGAMAFAFCENLRKVSLPYGLQKIQKSLFSGCTRLKEIDLPNGLQVIEGWAFSNCSDLTKINLPDDIQVIADSTFSYCSKLTKVNLPKNLKNIEEKAFAKCAHLTEINLPESLQSIGDRAFEGCTKLSKIHLPKRIKDIGIAAFSKCANLAEVYLPNIIKKLSSSIFEDCESLPKITFPGDLQYIGSYAFKGCINISDIHLPKRIREIEEYTFYGCTNLREIRLPNSLQYILNNAFDDCINLCNINFPNSLRYIGRNAFKGCKNLYSAHFPEGIESIYDEAFIGCFNLTELIFSKKIGEIEDNAFEDCYRISQIYVPKNTKEYFKKFYALKDYKDKLIEI